MSSQRYISDTLKQKKKKVKKIKVYVITFIVVLCLAGLIYFIRLPQIQISQVQISGNTFVETQEIKDKTDTLLNSFTLGFIPDRNIFLFSKKQLEKKLKENPAIVSTSIQKSYFDTLVITVTEQEKEMVYCASVERIDCLYINKTGFIYAKVEGLIIPEQEVIIYNEQGAKNIQDTILDETLYIDVVSFIKSAARYDVKIGEVYIKADGIIEFVTRDNTRIITSIYDDFEKDFEHFVALFDKAVLTKEQIPEIEYFDLRFGNKVFYKNKTN
jgi:cell division septal protein FtsQ